MTHQEYIAQNKLGFEGDVFLKARFEQLIADHKIDKVIETGSYRGCTTRELANMAHTVFSVEVVEENFRAALLECFGFKNVTIVKGSSEKVLPSLIENAPTENTLFFLDAHWQQYNPLLDELKVIASFGLKPVIIIHDFKVPGRPELGFDSYAGQDYDFAWIKKDVEGIYGVDGYNTEYNTEATGAKRGVIVLSPKK